MPGTYEVAGPGEVGGPSGFRLCSGCLQKVEQTQRRDNVGIMRIFITEPCVCFVIAVTEIGPGHDSCRALTCVIVCGLQPSPGAAQPHIVPRAITHSSKRQCNRKDSCPSHFDVMWLQLVGVHREIKRTLFKSDRQEEEGPTH